MSIDRKRAEMTPLQADSPAPRSKVSGVRALLDRFESGIRSNSDLKISVTEYIRLVQLEREMESEEPGDVEVIWIDISDGPLSGGG